MKNTTKRLKAKIVELNPIYSEITLYELLIREAWKEIKILAPEHLDKPLVLNITLKAQNRLDVLTGLVAPETNAAPVPAKVLLEYIHNKQGHKIADLLGIEKEM